MNAFAVRRAGVLAAFGIASGLAACQDSRVQDLDTGISRDSAITIMGQDAPKGGGIDSMPNVYWRETYLIAGRNYEVLYFDPEGRKAKVARDTNYAGLTPVVMIENRMVGKGWEYWDSLSRANKIPLKKRVD